MAKLKDIRPQPLTIVLDKPRRLIYDLNAFAELETIFGSVEESQKALETGGFVAARALLWAGLLADEPTLTLRDVGAMLGPNSLEMVMERIAQAMQTASPDAKETTGAAKASADPQ